MDYITKLWIFREGGYIEKTVGIYMTIVTCNHDNENDIYEKFNAMKKNEKYYSCKYSNTMKILNIFEKLKIN